ncbi:MAG: hypothetical protein OXB95_05240 [Rhodobacteraceae bacterium]|nr:hypothetical protein [Paracoccaceae bacterium]
MVRGRKVIGRFFFKISFIFSPKISLSHLNSVETAGAILPVLFGGSHCPASERCARATSSRKRLRYDKQTKAKSQKLTQWEVALAERQADIKSQREELTIGEWKQKTREQEMEIRERQAS